MSRSRTSKFSRISMLIRLTNSIWILCIEEVDELLNEIEKFDFLSVGLLAVWPHHYKHWALVKFNTYWIMRRFEWLLSYVNHITLDSENDSLNKSNLHVTFALYSDPSSIMHSDERGRSPHTGSKHSTQSDESTFCDSSRSELKPVFWLDVRETVDKCEKCLFYFICSFSPALFGPLKNQVFESRFLILLFSGRLNWVHPYNMIYDTNWVNKVSTLSTIMIFRFPGMITQYRF